MSDTFHTYRNVVSRVFRLSMLIAAKRHASAADVFDGFLEDLGTIVGNAGSPSIQALDEFLEREPPSPCSPPVEEADAHIIPVPVHMIIHEEEIHVEKVASPSEPTKVVEIEATKEEKAAEETEVEVEAEEEKTEVEVEAEEKAPEAEVVESEAAEETEEEAAESEGEVVESEETEEEVEETEGEVAETEETEEEVEETEGEVVESEETEEEVEETEGEVVETEETEEEVEETEGEVVETEETEETQEAEGRGERGTVGSPEEAEEEEGSFEPIKIGKTMYFVDTTTQNVFAYISDEEAGDLVGKLVNGKLVRA